jgi:hypothetical protein
MVVQSRKLRLVTIDAFPSTAFNKCERFNGCKTPGADTELLEIALRIAGIDYEFIERRDVESPQAFEMLSNGSADMTALALRITPERTAIAVFTTPIDFLQYGWVCSSMRISFV